MSAEAKVFKQSQTYRDIVISGTGNTLVINQTIDVSQKSVLARPFNERSPYLGLRRFEEDEQSLFFGRDQTIEELLQLVRSSQFALVAGASGSGKSSLVRAGLVPQLRQRLVGLKVFTLVPDRDPFEPSH